MTYMEYKTRKFILKTRFTGYYNQNFENEQNFAVLLLECFTESKTPNPKKVDLNILLEIGEILN